MTRRPSWIASLVIALGLVAVGAPAGGQEAEPSCRLIRGAETPEDPTDDVTVCRQDVWFHQAGSKAGNMAGFGQDEFPSWDTTQPDASVTAGAGGGYLASSATHQSGSPYDPQLSATFDGTYTGDFDTLAVTLFLFPPAGMAQGETGFRLNSQILVDGEIVWAGDDTTVKMTEGGQAVRRIDFAYTNVYRQLESLGLTGAGREHKIRMSFVGTGLVTSAALFVYDTTEVPSGMIFNIEPENLGAYTEIRI